MTTHNTDIHWYPWPERDEPDAETRTVLAFLCFIAGGFTDGKAALIEAAADDAGVHPAFARSVLQLYVGRFWEAQRVGARMQYKLLPPSMAE